MKKYLCFLLACSMGFALFSAFNGGEHVLPNGSNFATQAHGSTPTEKSGHQTSAGHKGFGDIHETDWYCDTVNSVYNAGLMVGTSDTTFDPHGSITIAQAVTMAVRAHSGGDSLANSNGSSWYGAYVDYAIKNGIINESDFADYDNTIATRAQMAYIFSNVIPQDKRATTSSLTPPDVDQSDEYGQEIHQLYGAGILTGNDAAGTFSPHGNIKRAEAAAIILRIHSLLAEESAQASVPAIPAEQPDPANQPIPPVKMPVQPIPPAPPVPMVPSVPPVPPAEQPTQQEQPVPPAEQPTQQEQPASPEPSSTPQDDSELEKEVFELVNVERQNHGLRPLTWDEDLAALARAHSLDMALRDFFDHTNPDGQDPFDRMKDAGISYRRAAENIAAGQRSPESVMNSWMNSAGHRANILDGDVTHIGVGFYNYHWTQNFVRYSR